jgi:hypothetical protein
MVPGFEEVENLAAQNTLGFNWDYTLSWEIIDGLTTCSYWIIISESALVRCFNGEIATFSWFSQRATALYCTIMKSILGNKWFAPPSREDNPVFAHRIFSRKSPETAKLMNDSDRP